MPAAKWSDAEKQHALDVYVAEGAARAHEETGIPLGTIKSWAARSKMGLQGRQRENTRRATEAAVERRRRALEERRASVEESRSVLVEKLSVAAELAVDRAIEMLTDREADLSARDAMAAARMAIHDLQLLAGAATSRPDWSAAEPEERRARIVQLTLQLEEKARLAEAVERAGSAGGGGPDVGSVDDGGAVSEAG